MKPEIHPEYMDARIVCACGRVSETRATVEKLHVEICSHCHPFFTGKQKLVDTAGRVERFLSKYGREDEAEELAAEVQERAEASEKLEMEKEEEEEAEEAEETAADAAAGASDASAGAGTPAGGEEAAGGGAESRQQAASPSE